MRFKRDDRKLEMSLETAVRRCNHVLGHLSEEDRKRAIVLLRSEHGVDASPMTLWKPAASS